MPLQLPRWTRKLPRLQLPLRRKPRPPSERRFGRDVLESLKRTLRRYSLLRDVLGALLIVGIVVGGTAGLTGGVWPPVLAVESGSMMIGASETPYGRFGTIDVGDLVFVRAVPPDEVDLWVEGGEHQYGRPGDVIAYQQNGDRGPENLTILHRAITFITVTVAPNGTITYAFPWLDGEVQRFGPQGIYFPPLGFDERFGFTTTNGYRPGYSGFVTKGDNPLTNPTTDQAAGISRLVHPTWLVGELYGEVPWVGLAKLTFQSGRTNPQVMGWERIGNAFAPIELWSCFFVIVALVVLVPFAVGTWKTWREVAERDRLLAQPVPDYIKRQPPPPKPQPPVAAPKRVATFVVAARPLSPPRDK